MPAPMARCPSAVSATNSPTPGENWWLESCHTCYHFAYARRELVPHRQYHVRDGTLHQKKKSVCAHDDLILRIKGIMLRHLSAHTTLIQRTANSIADFLAREAATSPLDYAERTATAPAPAPAPRATLSHLSCRCRFHLPAYSCIMQSNMALSSMEVEAAPSEAKPLPPKPKFEPLKPHEMSDGQVQFRKVTVPQHRYNPLKKAWMDIYTPIYEQMKIDIRMNLKARKVELKTRPDTPDISNLQKCADFVHAFMMGFDVIDAIALLRMDELYVESFEIKDVKTLRGDHLSRAIGRLSGKGGKTKFAIENATKTRIVIADTKIHILGSFANIKIARDSLCSLILGSPAGKVYSKLRAVTARLAERF
ncbi:hypothetical protein PIB30_047838 [Stylosanthes scabra]|uniref:K Homology domain-containing protein n=1 Tax=Stylosanthes scabra TaxID=79078 RepID=A0ABU6RHH4_9FABA|nr:hypothetical protein [Stylosanthes scabra]